MIEVGGVRQHLTSPSSSEFISGISDECSFAKKRAIDLVCGAC
ncbi:hypothetical protein CEV32_4216 [Brucella rhizosphaerae]|uniref:Uncharacterized protein n=1 Tax=Brucella rhizosphaerae TaxID=571254 RepID=A0A256FP09_9HYPH|nr:hypothetical protein CEV32_4216 [Brucella rhizosphaerae]